MGAFYTRTVAEKLVGNRVTAAMDLPGVPLGSEGKVVGCQATEARGWTY